MTCSVMFDRMLEADLHELSGRGETAVAVHVRACARCRAVANQLVHDTDALSRTIGATPATTVHPPRAFALPARTAAIVGLAAAVAVIVVRQTNRPTRSPMASGPVVIQAVTVTPPVAPPVAMSDPVPHAQARRTSNRLARVALPTGRAIQPSAVTVEPTVARSVQPAVAVLPVRIAPAPRQPLGNTLTVDPPAGKRANIIRTNRPGVTVVWLYD